GDEFMTACGLSENERNGGAAASASSQLDSPAISWTPSDVSQTSKVVWSRGATLGKGAWVHSAKFPLPSLRKIAVRPPFPAPTIKSSYPSPLTSAQVTPGPSALSLWGKSG